MPLRHETFLVALDRELSAFVGSEADSPVFAWRIGTAGLSSKKYYRIQDRPGLVLLDGREDRAIVPRIAAYTVELAATSLRTPRLLKVDRELGVALIEDLGDLSVTAAVAGGHNQAPLLVAALRDLASLRDLDWSRSVAPQWTPADAVAELVHLRGFLDRAGRSNALRQLIEAWLSAYSAVAPGLSVLSLSDVSPDNIHVQNIDPPSVVFIDFEDARRHAWEYDMVSLLQNVRQPFDLRLHDGLIEQVNSELNLSHDDIVRYYMLGLQRALRIYGLFDRLIQAGASTFAAYLPFVSDYISLNADRAQCPRLAAAVVDCQLPRSADLG